MLSFFSAPFKNASPRSLLTSYVCALACFILAADLDVSSNPASIALKAWVQSIPASDKVGHFLLFGFLAFLVNLTVVRAGSSVSCHLRATAWVSGIVLAEECSQIFLPHRNFDFSDILADLAGIILFSAFAYLLRRGKMRA